MAKDTPWGRQGKKISPEEFRKRRQGGSSSTTTTPAPSPKTTTTTPSSGSSSSSSSGLNKPLFGVTGGPSIGSVNSGNGNTGKTPYGGSSSNTTPTTTVSVPKIDRSRPNKFQEAQMKQQLEKDGRISDFYIERFGGSNQKPEQTFYTDDQMKDIQEGKGLQVGQQVNTVRLSDGRYLDTSNMTPQQVHAAQLMDEVSSGKRTRESLISVLRGMGLDNFGNKLPSSGGTGSGIVKGGPAFIGVPGSSGTNTGIINKPVGVSTTAQNPQSAPVNSSPTQVQPSVGAAREDNAALKYIEQLNAARKEQTLNSLAKSRDAALSNLSGERSQIGGRYSDARNQTAAGSQQNARNFQEFMASRGGSTSGASAQAEISRMGALQGNLGALGRQETQAHQDIARRESDIRNAYGSDVAAAEAGMQADRMQALLNQMNVDRGRDLQLAQLMGVYQGQKTLGGQSLDMQRDQFGWGQQMDMAGLTGNIGGQQTLAAQNQAFNQNMSQQQFGLNQQVTNANLSGQYIPAGAQNVIGNLVNLKSYAEQNWSNMTPQQQQEITAQADQLRNQLAIMGVDPALFGSNVTSGQAAFNTGQAYSPTMDTQNQLWNQNMAEQQFQEGVRQFGVETALRQAGLEQDAKQFAQQMGLNWAQLDQRAKEFVADQTWKKKNYDLQQQQIKGSAEDYFGIINKSPFIAPVLETDPNNPFGVPRDTGRVQVTDREGLERFIFSLGLSNEEMAKLYRYYNIPMQ